MPPLQISGNVGRIDPVDEFHALPNPERARQPLERFTLIPIPYDLRSPLSRKAGKRSQENVDALRMNEPPKVPDTEHIAALTRFGGTEKLRVQPELGQRSHFFGRRAEAQQSFPGGTGKDQKHVRAAKNLFFDNAGAPGEGNIEILRVVDHELRARSHSCQIQQHLGCGGTVGLLFQVDDIGPRFLKRLP